MKNEIALKKVELFFDLFSMLTTYVNDCENGIRLMLDERGKHDYETICSLAKDIKKEHTNIFEDTYMFDVNTALDKTIELLTHLEDLGRLTDSEHDEFDAICRIVLEGQEIECSEHIQVGKMIVCEGLPYQIIEIDYEDFSVRLWSGDEDDKGYWESPLNCVGEG